MSIYTRGGDSGTTSLADGSRVPKFSARIEAVGTVDEANSAVGLARVTAADATLANLLAFIQQRLFNCSSALASPEPTDRTPRIAQADIDALEGAIDRFESRCEPLTCFVVESGCETAARLHVARAVMRRAERRCHELASREDVDAMVPMFLNRASDALFAAARYANACESMPDEPWDPDTAPPTF